MSTGGLGVEFCKELACEFLFVEVGDLWSARRHEACEEQQRKHLSHFEYFTKFVNCLR